MGLGWVLNALHPDYLYNDEPSAEWPRVYRVAWRALNVLGSSAAEKAGCDGEGRVTNIRTRHKGKRFIVTLVTKWNPALTFVNATTGPLCTVTVISLAVRSTLVIIQRMSALS